MDPKLEGNRWLKDFEEPIRSSWRKEKAYKFDQKTRKPIFSIDTPPPYVNAPIHAGQATVYTIMDIIARFKRMRGFEVLFPLGLDRNGLPIEVATEREFKVSLSNTPREKFIGLCEKLLSKSTMESLETFYKLGHSYNSWNPGEKPGDVYYTDSESYRKLTQETFIDLWNSGMVYQSSRINNYCPGCRTTIADSEIEYKDLPTTFNYIKFKVKETGKDIIIATTRPELLCTCEMVLFNPKDDRYKNLEGKHAIIPIFNKVVPIKAHQYAKIESGTGLVMMCSFGDYTDIRFFREQNLKPIIAIDSDGKMNKNAGFLEGLAIREAREKIVAELKSKNLIEKQEKTIHRTPVCERSKDPMEFISMPEYYLKQLDIRPEIRKISDKIKFYAPESKQILLDWIESISMDWAISRRRYYATEVPLWYCKCGEIIIPPKGRYYRPWKEKPPIQKCSKCGGKEFIGEERVFDTWFDSSISPLYIMGYHHDQEFFNKNVPCSLRPQGKEIVRTWLYYTLLRCYQLTKKPIFKNVWIHYHVLDEKGNKMSKSLGNVIDPLEIIEKFGAEPFRLWTVLEGNITKIDLRCSFERIEGSSKFLTKLWNVSRFVSMFPEKKVEKAANLTETDKWILKELDDLVGYALKEYEDFNFHGPVSRIKHFIWEIFASHYLELAKNRAYNHSGKFSKEEQESAWYTLNHVLDTLLLILAPVVPFITYKIYHDLRGKDVHSLSFPEPDPKMSKMKLDFSAEELMELNSNIWKAKKDKLLSLKAEIRSAKIPEKFKKIEKDLKETHNIKEIKYGKDFKIEL